MSIVDGYQIRKIILSESYRAHVGHIGSALSIADIIAALYSEILNISDPKHPERDRFILSKGHAALALYAALYLRGWITEEALHNYCGDDTFLGVHPEHVVPGVDFSTGSLGQGLSYGTGAALAARLQRSHRRVFVLISDAECNEGSVWEAAMFAAHHQLANLILIIDQNGQQALGYTREVMDLSSLSERWRSFRWDVHEVDGHDVNAISGKIKTLDTVFAPPHVLIANTVFGKGVSFMENQIRWHYLPMSREEFEQAMDEIQNDWKNMEQLS